MPCVIICVFVLMVVRHGTNKLEGGVASSIFIVVFSYLAFIRDSTVRGRIVLGMN